MSLYNDEIHNAAQIISAADGRGTIFDLHDSEYTNRKIRKLSDGKIFNPHSAP